MERYEPDLRQERPRAVDWATYETFAESKWSELLEKRTDEKAFQEFLEENPSFLPGSVDNVGPGGHHGPWWGSVISQPPLVGLGPRRVPDFMWVRRDTDSTRPILIEIERPTKRWYTADLVPTADLTQAMDQLYEWRSWFSKPTNISLFNETYVPARYRERELRPQYVLVYGRNAEFRPGGHQHHTRARRKRDLLGEQNGIYFYTLDMLRPRIEAANYGTIARKHDGFSILTIPPTFETDAFLLREGTLLDASSEIYAALTRTPLLSDNRRDYLELRWNYWRGVKQSRDWQQNRGILASGSE